MVFLSFFLTPHWQNVANLRIFFGLQFTMQWHTKMTIMRYYDWRFPVRAKNFCHKKCSLSRGNESKIVWEMNCLRKQNGPDLNFLPGNGNNISNETPFYIFVASLIYSSVALLTCKFWNLNQSETKIKLVENLPFKGRNELLNKMNETACRWWQNFGESKMAFSRRIVPAGLHSYQGRICNIS